MKFYSIIFYLIFMFFNDLTRANVCNLICNNSSQFEKNFNFTDLCSIHAGVVHNFCCNVGNTTVGLDLRLCKRDIFDNLIDNFKRDIKFMIMNGLQVNETTSFCGYHSLDLLEITNEKFCPGDISYWKNIVLQNDSITCQSQLNICGNQSSITCPKNSICFPNGPNCLTCNCMENYSGYKCLNKVKI